MIHANSNIAIFQTYISLKQTLKGKQYIKVVHLMSFAMTFSLCFQHICFLQQQQRKIEEMALRDSVTFKFEECF